MATRSEIKTLKKEILRSLQEDEWEVVKPYSHNSSYVDFVRGKVKVPTKIKDGDYLIVFDVRVKGVGEIDSGMAPLPFTWQRALLKIIKRRWPVCPSENVDLAIGSLQPSKDSFINGQWKRNDAE